MIFREGSPDDWYAPGEQGSTEVSEEEIVSRFAHLGLTPECEEHLLPFAGLPHLVPAIEEARIQRLEQYLD